jgi:hypothetical protein
MFYVVASSYTQPAFYKVLYNNESRCSTKSIAGDKASIGISPLENAINGSYMYLPNTLPR